MKYVNLGNTGLKVSEICLGCMSFGTPKWLEWVLEEEQSMVILKKAWELGINFFDTANVYSNGESERILGKFIKEQNIPRENIVIATKVYGAVDKSGQQRLLIFNEKKEPNTNGLSKKHILHAVEDSLQRLGTDCRYYTNFLFGTNIYFQDIDLYIIHRWDYDTPIEETMETLHELVKSGKVRYIGASSMWAWQFIKAQNYAEKKGLTKFVSMQNLYHMIYREEERDMIPYCLDEKVALTPYSPLSKGMLARAHQFVDSEKMDGESKKSFNVVLESK